VKEINTVTGANWRKPVVKLSGRPSLQPESSRREVVTSDMGLLEKAGRLFLQKTVLPARE